ncbi:MAG: glucosamine-6-phosphate deaminase [Micrococcales bacterium]|nr:glucosamine-6-phosphate deaminase [Micrococcales bacterium]
MEVVILPSESAIADLAASALVALVNAKPTAVIGLATGSSPLALYRRLIQHYQASEISFAQAKAFMLDEYVGIDPAHPERYRNVIETEIASQVDFAPGAVQGPDGNAADLAAACQAYDQAIKQSGGIDLQILGIGSDGHIAFNEPGSSFTSRTRLVVLTEQTIADNARFFGNDPEAVPIFALTQGLGTIMESRHALLVATGAGKAQAVKQMVEGGVSAMWPASILQFHPHVTVLLDPAAAAQLELADYYKHAFANKPSWQAL